MEDNVFDFKVENRKDFAAFVSALQNDFLKNGDNWENNNLNNFLEAMSAYANDIQGYYNNTNSRINADEPNWQTFADILKGAIVYE